MDANNKSLVRRQRAPKTTADQYEVFLEYALRNQSIVDNKRDPLDSDLAVQQKWTDLTAILNTSGRGPQRKSKEWQSECASASPLTRDLSRGFTVCSGTCSCHREHADRNVKYVKSQVTYA